MTDAPPPLLVTLDDGVATLTLNRPEQLNSLTTELLLAIPRALDSVVADGARAVIVTGTGRGFCSGVALGPGGLEGHPDLGDIIETYFNPIARKLAALPVPVVTAINGPAVGAGASLALAGDIVVAARSAYILLAFANIGLVPDAGATWLVARAVGRVKALEMALLAEKLPAEAALAAGLVTRVVDDAALAAEAAAIGRRLAAMPTQALGMIRAQIRSALDLSFDESLAVEQANQRIAGFTEDHREGVLAFREKRAPVFGGR